MELIDKDALVAEIRKRLLPVIRDKHYDEWEEGQDCERIAILDIINTIEVKEVDLEKEIYDYFNAWQNVLCDEDCCNEGGFCCVLDENVKPVNIERCRKIAKHFYELGLKAKKGE